ncbi:MAG: hypothetical protein WD749_01305 [Phycisphaerales bacterium]
MLDIIADQEYLKEPTERLIECLEKRLRAALPLAFRTRKPEHENVLNDQIQAILSSDAEQLVREFPVLRYGTAKTIPDHATSSLDLFIEAKLLRGRTTASNLTDEMAADTVKYGKHRRILFVLYDPERAVADDRTFSEPFTKDGRCSVCFVR